MVSTFRLVRITLAAAIAVGVRPMIAAEPGQAPTEIRTADTALRFEVVEGVPKIDWLGIPGSKNWATQSSEALLPANVEIDGKPTNVRWSHTNTSQRDNTIRFTYESLDKRLQAISTWSAVAGPGPVEHEVTILNRGDAAVTFSCPATIALALSPPATHRLEHWWVTKGAGYMPETGGTFVEPINADYAKKLHSGPYSGDAEDRDAIPWFAVHDADGKCGIYGGIEFSGWTEIELHREDSGDLELSMGTQPRPGASKTRLKPGETYHYPTCFLGCYQGEVDDGCNRLHRWVETHLRPPMPWGVTPVLVNNSWGSGMAVDETLARKMIDDCAALGIEIYQVDAGWYRDVGNWHPNPEKFPRGLAPVSDYAHSKGLKFGLWVGWTQGGSSKSDDPNVLSVFNPSQKEWFGRDLPSDWKNQEYIGEPVCLGQKDARAWCLKELQRIIKEFKLDLLEHDQDMMLDECDRAGHDHRPGDPVDTSRATAEAYYDIYDQLRRENPGLMFEDCVNGGRLVDYGVIKRVHYICVTDSYDPHTCRRAFYDSSYPLPPSMIELYLENVPGDTSASFTSMLRSAMLGWATIMIDTTQWTPEQHEIAKREFSLYKEKLRPLIASANLYHILPRPLKKRWDGVAYFDPATGRGALYVFRSNAAESTQTIKLRGLDPLKHYQIESIDGSTTTTSKSGHELMETGLTLRIADKDGSDLLFLSAQG